MKLKSAMLLGMAFCVIGFAVDDTEITFNKITSASSGAAVTSVAGLPKADSNGRFPGFAVLHSSGVVNFDAIQTSGMAKPQVGGQFATTEAITGGKAAANVTSGAWSRPRFTVTQGALGGGICNLTWSIEIGNLPQPEGVYTNLYGRSCTGTSNCTPNDSMEIYTGAPTGPGWVYDGDKVCYATDSFYHDPDPYTGGDDYTLLGDTSVVCTATCS